MKLLRQQLRWALAVLLSIALIPVFAAEPASKPFAENKVVLQISDDDAFKQTLVLNVASNLISHYGPDRIDVEIVAFGPGLRLLFAENSNAERIGGLAENSGVRFSACENTTRKVTQALGHKPEFNPNTKHVSAGVVRIIDLVKQGYTLIKP
jgi:intracellular sulfur oxidation DsrE/DsrF family protein